jgi:hypothetical protein
MPEDRKARLSPTVLHLVVLFLIFLAAAVTPDATFGTAEGRVSLGPAGDDSEVVVSQGGQLGADGGQRRRQAVREISVLKRTKFLARPR